MHNEPTISPYKEAIDLLEVAMSEHPLVKEDRVDHDFAPGIYTRTIYMKAGDRVISKIHKTDHLYHILLGVVSVYIEGVGWELLTAPHKGETKAGTRRILYVHSDTIWSTLHPTSVYPKSMSKKDKLDAVALIEDQIIEKNQNVIELKKQRGMECRGVQL